MSEQANKPLTLRGLFYLSRELISKYGGDTKTNLVARYDPTCDKAGVDFITAESTRHSEVIKLCAEELLKEVREQLKLTSTNSNNGLNP